MTDSDHPTDPSISRDVVVAHLDDEAVLLHLGTKRYFRLNATGAAIWRALEQGCDVAATVASLVEDFEVDPTTAEAEVQRVLRELRERDLVEF
jgi:hypothetical protein